MNMTLSKFETWFESLGYQEFFITISLILVGIIVLVLNSQIKSTRVSVKMDGDSNEPQSNSHEFQLGINGSIPFNLTYDHFSKFCLLLGTTGAGKTVTIKNVVKAFIEQSFPVIYVDGKPSDGLIHFLDSQAKGKIKGFNCLGYSSYNFLKGTPSEVKDRIICIKDEWESDYYKTLASDYIQLVLKFLIAQGEQLTLEAILKMLDITTFLKEARNAQSDLIEKIIYFSSNTKSSELKGLYSHLSLIINSDFGSYLSEYNNDTIELDKIIENNGVAYFALPALKFPEFSSFIGKVVINDIKSSIERTRKPVLLIFDEFSVFAGGQVLNLINQGREFGAHTMVGTQSLEDLREWSDQILNNANMLISHRVHSNKTAEDISKYFGTKKNIQITRQLKNEETAPAGSVRSTREFFVHPDDLKTLGVGECFINIKDSSVIKKVKINYL
ncbi:MAG: TraM recognition domain-containing protein [Reichenbachiella sp.]|uniref:type IV secretory system conjugative DNA transfer family protein n=1 Tax=Reichenbachiella sp. TaxID=2184521 RepID=UPI002966923D|nr:TraM recognition domain-containing protein [Reichenbachiella sp.]MDW3209288.1 TraM recognition domain-containing protein [Reichenbachiella sp.]